MMTWPALFDLGQQALWFGAGVLFKGALLLAATALVVRLCRRSSASLRHLVWALGLMGVVLVSVATSLLPSWTVDAPVLLSASAHRVGFGSAPRVILDSRLATVPTASANSVAAAAPVISVTVWWPLALAALWALVALALLGRLALDLRAARGLARRAGLVANDERLAAILRAIAAEWRLARLPQLRESSEIDSPATVGLWRPVIMLPVHARQWGDQKAGAVIAHELAHVQRRDCTTQALARIVCALHWPNPLTWWAARRLLAEREMAADDAALRSGGMASDYAELLLELVQAAGSARRALNGALRMTDGSPLGERIARLLDPTRNRARVSRRSLALGTAGGLAVALGLGCIGASESRNESVRVSTPAVATRTDVSRGKLWAAVAPLDSQLGRRLAEAARREGKASGIATREESYSWPIPWMLATGPFFYEHFIEGPASAVRDSVVRVEAENPVGTNEKVLLEAELNGYVRTVVVDLTTRLDLTSPGLSLTMTDHLIAMKVGDHDSERLARLASENIKRRLALVVNEDRLLAAHIIGTPLHRMPPIVFRVANEASARALANALGVSGSLVVQPKSR